MWARIILFMVLFFLLPSRLCLGDTAKRKPANQLSLSDLKPVAQTDKASRDNEELQRQMAFSEKAVMEREVQTSRPRVANPPLPGGETRPTTYGVSLSK